MVTSNGEQTTDSVHEVPNQMQCIYLVQERWMKDESRKRETERKREERESKFKNSTVWFQERRFIFVDFVMH